MCIVYISISYSNKSVVIAANRDEFHERPSKTIHNWHDYPQITAGKDLKAGGTWLGWAKGNRFAFLTNYREPLEQNSDKPSRGDLVKNFLINNTQSDKERQNLIVNAYKYAGFNLILGDLEQVWYISNRYTKQEQEILALSANNEQTIITNHPDDAYQTITMPLKSGKYVLSNHLLNTSWPKTTLLYASMQNIPTQEFIDEQDKIFSLLHNTTKAKAEDLPATGLSPEFEALLSSPFIISADYGTRCSSIMVMQEHGGVFSERSFDNKGNQTEQHNLVLT